jgi:DNA topoisomerase-6 subunit A
MITNSLFRVDFLSHSSARENDSPHSLPYDIALQLLRDSEDERFAADELCIFSDVVQHESLGYADRGFIAGDLDIVLGGGKPKQLRNVRKPLRIPFFVEDEFLHFNGSAAKGVLLVERFAVFDQIWKSKDWSDIGLILVTGQGLPRINARRLLHRLSVELSLPVYVLVDNDTWGYFIYSLLKRGMLGPHAHNKFLSVPDLRFLGLRAGDGKRFEVASGMMRPWEEHWNIRIECMRGYRCFRRREWQKEFDAFLSQRGALDTKVLMEKLGTETFVRDYLRHHLEGGTWL